MGCNVIRGNGKDGYNGSSGMGAGREFCDIIICWYWDWNVGGPMLKENNYVNIRHW